MTRCRQLCCVFKSEPTRWKLHRSWLSLFLSLIFVIILFPALIVLLKLSSHFMHKMRAGVFAHHHKCHNHEVVQILQILGQQADLLQSRHLWLSPKMQYRHREAISWNCESHEGRMAATNRMNFQKSSKGGGGYFQFKNLFCRFIRFGAAIFP